MVVPVVRGSVFISLVGHGESEAVIASGGLHDAHLTVEAVLGVELQGVLGCAVLVGVVWQLEQVSFSWQMVQQTTLFVEIAGGESASRKCWIQFFLAN